MSPSDRFAGTATTAQSPARSLSAGARGFLFDLNRCTGCNACELACSTENELGWGRSWRQVMTFNEDRRPGLPSFHLSLACNHCAEAPCLDQCPALAIGRDTATGTVHIDSSRCIGCRYCSWVCPYDAPRFDEPAGVMGKCTLCSHRLREDRSPACVEGCPTGALRYGPLEGEEEIPGLPRTGARPALRFTPLLQGMRPPESTWSPDPELVASFAAARPTIPAGISLGSEWPLLIFTLLVSFLAGWILAAVLGGPAPPLPAFVAFAALAMGTSTLHLGRKERAWRAILNVRRSWLSREVAAFSAFAALSVAYLGIGGSGSGGALGGGAALAGLACLFCIDRVYDPVRGGRLLHSADTLMTGLLLAAVLLGRLPAAVALSIVKVVLYLSRRPWRSGPSHSWITRMPRNPEAGVQAAPTGPPGAMAGSPVPWSGLSWIAALGRLGAGLALPLALLAIGTGRAAGGTSSALTGPEAMFVLASFALGEVIDRIQFYRGLGIPTPRRTMADAAIALARARGSEAR